MNYTDTVIMHQSKHTIVKNNQKCDYKITYAVDNKFRSRFIAFLVELFFV